MTKNRTKQLCFFRRAMITLLVAVFAVLSLPFSLFGRLDRSRGASAETEETATVQSEEQKQESAPVVHAGGEDVELTVKYYDNDGNYDGYDLWLWNMPSGDGASYGHDFDAGTSEVEDYVGKKWKSATYTINNVDLSLDEAIGVIVRKSDWSQQTANLYVDGSKIVDNAITVYVVKTGPVVGKSLPANLYYTAEDAMANKITSANMDSFKSVVIKTTVDITNRSLFKVKDGEGNVVGSLDMSLDTSKDAYLTEKDKNGNDVVVRTGVRIPLTADASLTKTYKVVDEPAAGFNKNFNFVELKVNLASLYDLSDFETKYAYTGTLGAEYSTAQTKFTVWSPAATAVTLNIYAAGEGGTAETHAMTAGTKGVWEATVTGDLKNKYYTYTVGGKEVVDPYAKSAGRNGKRGMIIDLDSTDPEGWANHSRPAARGSYSNAIIYETHIRDLTMHESSNVSAEHKGKFLGLTERASAANQNKKTPLDHIVELGVTEVHILPMYDINSVDEYIGNAVFDGEKQYNWGYDPLNYNVPEGSYSTDPTDGNVRVKELKQMVMALHQAGIRVIMDVVYNHVADAGGSNFQALMPNYYFRTNEDGSFANGSGCGNDTASERAMYHKFMVDSVNYWADEYKLDGFRFDLMGLHDTVTMNKIYSTLAAKNPDIMVYGEGWKMGTMVETDDKKPADMYHASLMPNIAFFDDITRDALKGGGFGQAITAKGFVEGVGRDAAIYVGAVGATGNKTAGYGSLGKTPFASNPTQNINYVSCHDNTTLWDKINASVKSDLDARKAMNRIAAAAVMTSQGPMFFLAGEEMLRSKPVDKTAHGLTYDTKNKQWVDEKYDSRPYAWMSDSNYFFSDNSYKSPDSVNAIDWTLAETNSDMLNFYKQLIALRKNTPQFRLTTKEQIDQCVSIPDPDMKDGVVSYVIKDPDSNEYVVVLFNVTDAAVKVQIPNGTYSVYVNGNEANAETPLSTVKGDSVTVGSFSAMVMKSTSSLSMKAVYAWKNKVNPEKYPLEEESNLGLALGLGIGIPVAVLIAGGVTFGMLRKKKKSAGNDQPTDDNDAPEQPEEQPEAQPEEQTEQPEQPEAENAEE